ncbi:hypothetical protein DXT68_00205 [Microbacterium foliorum]|uniref:Uncharacterized protein n=1 Tax=Microbacterium foliorum TaxID=104336 RepID=A0A0F0KNU3_9MICO|nr:hypothetical protein [Microbacterium foliorum]AXL10739.1 hypothetical protein DXT68_00205 [Microbacterium foliorum]KJL21775.1 hypothetical protein RN50_01676 [Microbacterium foliorum]
MSGMRSVAGSTLVLLAGIALVGCGQSASVGTENQMLATYTPSGEPGGDGAQLAGVLEVRDGCVIFVNDQGDAVIPAFPEGIANWDGDTLRLRGSSVVPDQDIAVGEPADALGGGNNDGTADGVSVPTSCPTDAGVFVVAG